MRKENNTKKYHSVSKRKYFVLVIIIFVTCIIFLSIFNLDKLAGYDKLDDMKKSNQLLAAGLEVPRQDIWRSQDAKIWVASPQGKGILEVLEHLKIPSEEIAGLEMLPMDDGAEWLILDAVLLSDRQAENLLKICQSGFQNIIIYHTGDLDLRSSEIRNLLGIKRADGTRQYKGVRILNDFMLSSGFMDKQITFEAEDIDLEQGTKVFMTEYVEDYEKTSETAMVYRRIFDGKRLYVVNGPFMDQIPQGIITGILSNEADHFLYPVANTSFFIADDFPVLSIENAEALEKLYSRSLGQLIRHVLMQDIFNIGKSLNQKITFLCTDKIKEANEYQPDWLSYYAQEIGKQGGELGVTVDHSSSDNLRQWFFQFIPKSSVHSYHSTDGSHPDWLSDEDITAKISFDQKGCYRASGSQIELSVELNPMKTENFDPLSYYATLYAYGISSIGLNFDSVFYPQKGDWADISKQLSKFLGNYKRRIQYFRSSTAYEAAQNIARWEIMDPIITYGQDTIWVENNNFIYESNYLLKTDKTVVDVNNGSFKELEEGLYLITCTDKNAMIILEPSDLFYKKG